MIHFVFNLIQTLVYYLHSINRRKCIKANIVIKLHVYMYYTTKLLCVHSTFWLLFVFSCLSVVVFRNNFALEPRQFYFHITQVISWNNWCFNLIHILYTHKMEHINQCIGILSMLLYMYYLLCMEVLQHLVITIQFTMYILKLWKIAFYRILKFCRISPPPVIRDKELWCNFKIRKHD